MRSILNHLLTSLAADLAVTLHVDGGWMHADLRHDRAPFGPSDRLPDLLNCALLDFGELIRAVRMIDASLPFSSGLNVRNAAHPNDRLPLLIVVGSASRCAQESR